MKKLSIISLAILLVMAFCFSYVPKTKANDSIRQNKRTEIDAKRIEMKNKIAEIRSKRELGTKSSAKHICADEIWSGTKDINSDITIDFGSTVTVEPGTNIVFHGRYELQVNGNLVANGTATNSINFYHIDPGQEWDGVLGGAGSNINLDYCNFENANLSLDTFGVGSAQNCSFNSSYFDVWVEGNSNYSVSSSHLAGYNGINTFDNSVPLISNNYFNNPGCSILTYQNSDSTIRANQFVDCGYYIVDIEDDSRLVLDANEVNSNETGVFIALHTNSYAEIKNNTIETMGALEAIYLYDNSYAEIKNNNINGAYNGIVVYNLNGTIIENNNISNGLAGITVGTEVKVNIIHNNIINNKAYGIFLSSSTIGEINYNFIKNNNINSYEFCGGIVISDFANATINYNDILGNKVYGINNLTSTDINATKNYWGSNTGPTHASNPGGTGDAVTDNVDFVPWLDKTFITPPPINSVNLVEGQTVGGIYPINVDASWVVHGLPLDDMAKVDFYIDGVLMGTDTSAPYSYDWDTTVHSSLHTVRVVATNVLGTTNEKTVNVNVEDQLPYTGK